MRPIQRCAIVDAMTHEQPSGVPRVRDLPALVEFAAVARWEHVTRAAEELGVPQPTLSRRIRRLEEAFDVALFVRRGRRLELTPTGRRVAALVERTLGELETGLQGIARSVDPDAGTVTLGFLSTLGVTVVPRLLREFRAVRPAVSFQLVQDNHDAMLARLRRGELDVCLTSPLPSDADLAAVPLHEQPLRLVTPAGHPLSTSTRPTLASAAGEPFIGFKPGYGLRRITQDWCRLAGFTPRLAFEGEDVATVRGLVAAGLGVALLPAADPPLPDTAELALTDVRAVRVIGMVTTAGRRSTPPARAFETFLRDHAPRLIAAER